MTLLSLDPGFRYFGWAAFSGKTLQKAGRIDNRTEEELFRLTQPPIFTGLVDVIEMFQWETATAVIEFPVVRVSTPNTEALLKLSSACGAYTSLLQAAGFSVEWVFPSTWKGSVPKKIMCRRIVDKLSPSEYSCIDKPRDHNVLDAIGVGLWKIQRL